MFSGNFHGKSIVEAERRPECKPETRFVLAFNFLIVLSPISLSFLFQNGGKGSACVFRIDIDSPSQYGLLANVRSRKVETAFHLQMRARFDELRKHLAEYKRLGKILASNHDSI